MTKSSTNGPHGPVIRLATHHDLDRVTDLGQRSFTDTFGHLYRPENLKAHLDSKVSTTYFSGVIDDPDHQLLIAEIDEQLAGFMIYGPMDLPVDQPDPNSFELHRLYMDKSFKRQGLGQAFMLPFFEEARKRKASTLYLSVYSENYPAIAFYEKHGFSFLKEYLYPVGDQLDREFIFSRPL